MDWLGMFVPRINLRKQPTESLNAPQEDDLERLSELREQGSRVDLPHPIRAFVRTGSEAPARATAELLRKEGYRCTVRAGQDGSWTVTAVTQMVPTPGAITKLREQLQAVASANEGSYLGWDAPVIY